MARVMVVDDSKFMRQVLRNILTRAGHEVVAEADSGEAALAEYGTAKPDIVTLDLVMPGMGGMECLKQMRASDSDAKVVVVSAVGQKAEVNEAVALGASDYVVKPFDEEQVLKTLGEILG